MMCSHTVADITVEQPSEERLRTLKVRTWPIWEKEISTFPWHYDEQETCYFLAGRATVVTPEGEVAVGQGDLVTFPKGLDCTWRITGPVRKHYTFG